MKEIWNPEEYTSLSQTSFPNFQLAYSSASSEFTLGYLVGIPNPVCLKLNWFFTQNFSIHQLSHLSWCQFYPSSYLAKYLGVILTSTDFHILNYIYHHFVDYSLKVYPISGHFSSSLLIPHWSEPSLPLTCDDGLPKTSPIWSSRNPIAAL